MTRAASLLLRVVGLALVLAAAVGLVLVGDGGAWTARGSVPAGRTAVLVEPAVASVLGPTVTVHVVPAGDEDDETALFVGRGRSDDLAAYAQDPHVIRVVGFDGSRRLKLQDGPAPASSASTTPAGSTGSTGSASPGAAGWQPPTTVDLWQEQVSGTGERALTWRPTSGARSILVAREDGTSLPALDVAVTWTDARWIWYPVAALVLGLVLLAGGYLLAGGLPMDAARGGFQRARAALRSRGPVPVRPVRRRTEETAATEVAAVPTIEPTAEPTAEGTAEPTAEATTPGLAEPPRRPAQEPTPVGEPASEPGGESDDDAPQTRRAARGRRRKETVWQRARTRALPRGEGRR